ncbi:MAG: substrate-binding domain-containing protein [Clostridia bacterium]|nr:substrate-binding domain-containing protein [Clostridia bacterium]
MKTKKLLTILLSAILTIGGVFGLTACGGEKNITVVARHQGSGTREAFDRVVTDGNGNYLEMKVDGKTTFFTTDKADLQPETGNVMSKVASDKNAIGYISLGSVNDTIKVVNVNGVAPSAETVLDGSYKMQRPFVIMTSSTVTLTDIAADFLLYLKSEASETHAEEAGCIYLADPAMRANEGETAIPVVEYEVKSSLPSGGKIVVNGSTSMEKFIKKAMSGYASLYGRTADELFTLDLQGSSVGKTAVQNDKNGNVIGLSSASVKEEGINSFNVCLDAVAVIVNNANTQINNLTLAQLYDIYTGKVTKFSEIVG